MIFQTCIEMECEYIAFLWADSKCITGKPEIVCQVCRQRNSETNKLLIFGWLRGLQR